MLYEVVLTFKSVDEALVCDHSNETIEQYFHVVLMNLDKVAILHFCQNLATFSHWGEY